MNREKLKKCLEHYGYKADSIKSLMTGRMKPDLRKAYNLEDKFNIPVSAWRDIKSYLQNNDTKNQQGQPVQKASWWITKEKYDT